MIPLKGSKARMIWEHVNLPFFNYKQILTPLYFPEQTKYESGELPERQVVIFGSSRMQFRKVVRNWNNTDNDQRMMKPGNPIYTQGQSTNQDRTMSDTENFLDSPRNSNRQQIRSVTGNLQSVSLQTRNELGTLLHSPSSLWWWTN